MAKRGAEEQITKDNLNLQGNDTDEVHGPSYASADVIAKRRILKPKGKSLSGSKSSPQFHFSATSKNGTISSGVDVDKNLRLKALNLRFVEAVKSTEGGQLADYRSIAHKYIEYYSSIETGESSSLNSTSSTFKTKEASAADKIETEKKNPFANISFGKPAITPKQVQKSEKNVSVDSDGDSDTEDEKKKVRIEGPKFTLTSKPTIKKSPFSFGPKPAKKVNDDSSDSEIEIKGPSFTFNKVIKDPVFNVKSESTGQAQDANVEKIDSTKKNETKDQASHSTKSTFSFGSKMESTSNTPTFQFGSTAQSKDKPSEEPPFQFGKTNAESAQSNPPFQFGNKGSQSNDSKPIFQFGSSEAVDERNAPLSSTQPKQAKQAFLFGSIGMGALVGSSSTLLGQSSQTMPLSTLPFGGPGNENSDKPALGSSSGSASTLFFGTSNNSVPFGSKIASTSSLGQSKTGSSTPSFVTGAQTDNILDVSKGADLVAEEDSGAQFTPVASLGTEKVDTSNSGEEGEQILFQRKSKLMLLDVQNKENPYTNMGIGELKVLKGENGKSRILMRADGGLRVLLNVSLLKDITYTTIGNGSLVRVPAVGDSGVLQTYVLKVKTPIDGKELCDTLNKANNVSAPE